MKTDPSERTWLLKPVFRRIGLVLLVPGVVLAFFRYYYRWAPEWLDIQVFALSSNYLEEKTFTFVLNNVTEEIAWLFLIVGIFLIILSREKAETETTSRARANAWIITGWTYFAGLIVVVGFTFGLSFVESMFYLLALIPLSYLVAFSILKRVYSKRESTQ